MNQSSFHPSLLVLSCCALIIAGMSADHLESSNDTAAAEDIQGNGHIPGEASRSPSGLPTDPHPGSRLIYTWKQRERLLKRIYKGILAKIWRRTEPEPWERYFAGQGIMVDEKHLLLDEATLYKAMSDSRPGFNHVGFQAGPREIDVSQPPESHYSQVFYRLMSRQSRLNKTNLQIYVQQRNLEPSPSGDPPAKLETNPHEYGWDCFVHSYREVLPSEPGADLNASASHASTKLQYVKTPIRRVKPSDCRKDNSCTLTTNYDSNFCARSGAGSPIFCGSEQKLTYMAKHVDDQAECRPEFEAYHIPRLIGGMGLPRLKASNRL